MYLFFCTLLSVLPLSSAQDSNEKLSDYLSGDLSLQSRGFFEKGVHPGQEDQQDFSASALLSFEKGWNNDRSVFTFKPFFRADAIDQRRTHGDIRQLDYVTSFGNWEIRAGISKIYWGVAESAHLVDTINQTDFVENFDGEQKLGQPMLNVNWVKDFGTFELFILPYFRLRTFPGSKGRLRFQIPVAQDDATFESKQQQSHIDGAVRWSHSVGWFDIGLSHFYGTSREPIYRLQTAQQRIVPHYTLMHQSGLDLQMTYEGWLVKLEAITRKWNEMKDFTSIVAGFEYTFGNLWKTGADVGLLVEYLKDSRSKLNSNGFFEATTPFENDVFTGLRLALNDENDLQFLGGIIFDMENSSKFINLEASRRIGNSLLVSLEARIFSSISSTEFLAGFATESYGQLEATYSF